MISTGVVRKIDDLGRIVIPKEIRKSLGIRDGENLEIVIEDNNIILSKKNIINSFENNINELIDSLSIIVSGEIVVTDREKVIGSNSIKIKQGELLSKKLIHYLDERISFNDNKMESFEIGENILNGYFLVLPIISDGNALGLIIIYNQAKQVNDYYMLAKFISLFLARKIDISC